MATGNHPTRVSMSDAGSESTPLLHGTVQKVDQRIEEATDVQDAAGLALDSQLGPRGCLEELLEGAKPSGKHDEGIRRPRHRRFSIMHRFRDLKAAQTPMGHLLPLERSGDHSVDLATGVECGISDQAH
jgi:hypothetical protein